MQGGAMEDTRIGSEWVFGWVVWRSVYAWLGGV